MNKKRLNARFVIKKRRSDGGNKKTRSKLKKGIFKARNWREREKLFFISHDWSIAKLGKEEPRLR
jgi:hypothetical protein